MSERTGLWLIGAYGSVATCLTVGLEAFKLGRLETTGLVTQIEPFASLPLAALASFELGGHDVREGELLESAWGFHRSAGVFSAELIRELEPVLARIDERIRVGCALNCGEAVREFSARGLLEEQRPLRRVVEAIREDLDRFQQEASLERVVVVNLASTEPYVSLPGASERLDEFEELLDEDRREAVPASLLYAYAAIGAGRPYLNFTPSPGSSPGALRELARRRQVPHMGKDGKTGETLLKTALAPMFLARNLKLLSWEGHNILGNRDGQVLDSPENHHAKIADKDGALRRLVQDPDFHTRVRIDYVPSLGDWKTAWDFIHFEGFAGTKMSLQFTWQGCDSVLAAPLVLDMARFLTHAHRRGEYGLQRHLACFFKNPTDVPEQDFFRQFQMLLDYAEAQRQG